MSRSGAGDVQLAGVCVVVKHCFQREDEVQQCEELVAAHYQEQAVESDPAEEGQGNAQFTGKEAQPVHHVLAKQFADDATPAEGAYTQTTSSSRTRGGA